MAGTKRPHNDWETYTTARTPPSASQVRGHAPPQSSSHSRPSKAARTNSHPHTSPGSSQYDPVIIDDDEDDDDDASQEVQISSQSFGETDMSYVSYGVISTKIVGVRYYNGHATLGEIAIPRREPHNQYDRERHVSPVRH